MTNGLICFILKKEAPAAGISPKEVVARIREIRSRTKPDPEGWTIRDYINYGRR